MADVQEVKRAASGRWSEILSTLGGIPREVLDGRHHPCPKCGGNDRFRMIDEDAGALLCNRCFEHGNGDGISALQWLTGKPFQAVMGDLAGYLGVNGNGSGNGHQKTPTAILEAVARKKGVRPEDLEAYQGEVVNGAIRFPMFGPDGDICSSFTLAADGGKGLCEKGKPAGLFLPGRLPQAGESWLLVEGVKDAAALHGLGYLAAGLPTCRMNEKFAPLFQGVDVVAIPDGDTGGITGAEETARRLHGIASSVRIARLPGEVKESGGEDVRDVLRKFGTEGPAVVQEAIGAAKVAGPDGTPDEPPRFIKLLTCAELLSLDLKSRFLVRGVLVEAQPMIVGGRSKVLKTSIATDLVISLGSGTPFLGKFDTVKAPVGFWSGESGAATLRETARRQAEAKGIDLKECEVFWSFDLPKLTRLDHLDAMETVIRNRGLKVAVVDPLYLALLNAETAGSAGNLYAMGAALEPLSKLIQDTGCTLVVLHHFRKSGQVDDTEPAGPEELAQSGAAEWARQWLLLQRRSPFQSDGIHHLWMRCGGSAGHGSLWGLTVNEGQLDPDTFTGRKWEVTVSPASDARAASQRDRENRKAAEQEKREGEQRARLLAVLRTCPEGDTARGLRTAARLNPDGFDRAIFALIQEGRAVRCEVTNKGGKYEGFKPTGK